MSQDPKAVYLDWKALEAQAKADFEQIAIKPEVRPLILKENAVKLLGLDRS